MKIHDIINEANSIEEYEKTWAEVKKQIIAYVNQYMVRHKKKYVDNETLEKGVLVEMPLFRLIFVNENNNFVANFSITHKIIEINLFYFFQ